MNPTIIGLFSIVVWGIAIPFVRMIEEQIGVVAYIGALFTAIVVMGLINHLARRRPLPDKKVFRNPFFYWRWLFFLLHDGLLISGISLVQKAHMPFLILINYLWPTAIIVSSILLAGVKITRWWAFILGSLVVIASLTLEILGPAGLSPDLFAQAMDCLAYGMVFGGAVAWGLYSALSRRFGETAGGSAVIPLYQLTLATLLPVSFMPGVSTWEHLGVWGALIFAAYSFMLFLSYLTWDHGMQRGNIVVLSLCADFIPWLSLLSANLLLGVEIGNKTVLSAIALVAGAMITRYGTLPKKALAAPYEEPGI